MKLKKINDAVYLYDEQRIQLLINSNMRYLLIILILFSLNYSNTDNRDEYIDLTPSGLLVEGYEPLWGNKGY